MSGEIIYDSDIPENSNKLSSSFSYISKLEISIAAMTFKIHSNISLNQKNNTELSACNVTTALLKLKKKANLRPRSYHSLPI